MKSKYMRTCLFLCCFCVALMGCSTNKFAQSYYSVTPEPPLGQGEKVELCFSPRLAALPEMDTHELELHLFEEGYKIIGVSAFRSSQMENESNLLAHGKAVGACLVLYNREFAGTQVRMMPVETVVPVTRFNLGYNSSPYSRRGFSPHGYSRQSHRRFGNRAPRNHFNGMGLSTYYARAIEYVPYSVGTYAYDAVYAAKIKYGSLGVKIEDTPDSYKRQFDTVTGALVVAVGNNTDAHAANILKGDILVSLNGKPVSYTSGFDLAKGSSYELKVYRNGKTLTKKITVGEAAVRAEKEAAQATLPGKMATPLGVAPEKQKAKSSRSI